MPLFGRNHYNRSYRQDPTYEHRRSRERRLGFGRRRHAEGHRDHVAAGYKAALSNPNTSRSGRKHAKHELRIMGRGHETHVPMMTKIKRALGMRRTPRERRRRRKIEDDEYRTSGRDRKDEYY